MTDDLLVLRTGALLRRRREASGLTLFDLHRRCGVTVAQLSRIENGLADPRLSTLVRILEATGGTLTDIVVRPITSASVDDVLDGRSQGRRRIEEAGLGLSDPAERLDRREYMGVDARAERARFGAK